MRPPTTAPTPNRCSQGGGERAEIAAPFVGGGLRIRLPRFYFAGVLSVLGGLLLWELVSRFLVANALFLAAPSQILAAIAALAKSGELWRHMSVSGIEFPLGYVIASV